MINKYFKDITEEDIIIKGFEIDTPEANQYMKKSFYNYELNRVKSQFNVIDDEFNLVLTDYFEDKIGDMTIIAERTTVAGPEPLVDKYKHWYFTGYCTISEFNIESWYDVLIERFDQYERNEFLLNLYVSGGIIAGEPLISKEKENYWRDRGIRVELLGFDTEGKMMRMTDILIEDFKKEEDRIQNRDDSEFTQEWLFESDTEEIKAPF